MDALPADLGGSSPDGRPAPYFAEEPSEFREKPAASAAADLDEWDDAVAEYRETHPGN